MTESEFMKFYKKRNKIKNRKEAKEKIDNFWNTMLKALSEDKRVVFKNWGIFEKKGVKARKIIVPNQVGEVCTEPKEIIKFKVGKKLVDRINERGENIE